MRKIPKKHDNKRGIIIRPYKAWCGKTPEQIADAREKAIKKIKSGVMGHSQLLGKGGRTDNADTIRAKMMLNSARCNVLFHEGNVDCEEWRTLQRENDMLAKKIQEIRVKEYKASGVKLKWEGIRVGE